ncbi:MAG: DUF1963 domain-containing protein [Verrucomicrobiaceae bacterium]|nr:DUF1963 domain-containing protein [Verrucomicrobiaceae bacterium]NCF92156.1 DUF1963 domain-containing protein [Verrucomicrobiaceae bacterium]
MQRARNEWTDLLEVYEEDLGCLNFWIPREDLPRQRFERVWISLGFSKNAVLRNVWIQGARRSLL